MSVVFRRNWAGCMNMRWMSRRNIRKRKLSSKKRWLKWATASITRSKRSESRGFVFPLEPSLISASCVRWVFYTIWRFAHEKEPQDEGDPSSDVFHLSSSSDGSLLSPGDTFRLANEKNVAMELSVHYVRPEKSFQPRCSSTQIWWKKKFAELSGCVIKMLYGFSLASFITVDCWLKKKKTNFFRSDRQLNWNQLESFLAYGCKFARHTFFFCFIRCLWSLSSTW